MDGVDVLCICLYVNVWMCNHCVCVYDYLCESVYDKVFVLFVNRFISVFMLMCMIANVYMSICCV